ncbi:glycosyltransferase family 4 protein [Sunxiuqinia indica]|uniref:glycosyltransferase family 4 protein n=1 Tax=Sunxiuqinia indica TaxID=2692584 RepID=UPI001357C0D2|nr:glycosyltransferase family 1 protein [Sunxiuqinia indica]
MPLKIGFDSKRAFHNTRGLGNYSRNLISGLVNYYPENSYYLFGESAKNAECVNWHKQISNQTTLINPGSSITGKALWRSYFSENEIRKQQLDIFHGLSHEIPFKKKNKHTKYVVTIHDLFVFRLKNEFKWIDRKIYLAKIKYSCRHADLIIAVSEQTKKDLIDLLHVPEEKIVVNYQSCSNLYYDEKNNECKQRVKDTYQLPDRFYLFVGALVKHKNIERIIEAIALLPLEIQYPLVIVGRENSYKNELIAIASKFKLEEKIQFVDFVTGEDLPVFYQLAELLIWPSLFEGFGIPIIEALFCKLPVITSNVGCFSEAGGEGALYVDPEQTSAIASAIEFVITDDALYAKLREKGHAHVQKFHIKNTSLHLMELYKSLLK